jgi:hypothetical protein
MWVGAFEYVDFERYVYTQFSVLNQWENAILCG